MRSESRWVYVVVDKDRTPISVCADRMQAVLLSMKMSGEHLPKPVEVDFHMGREHILVTQFELHAAFTLLVSPELQSFDGVGLTAAMVCVRNAMKTTG